MVLLLLSSKGSPINSLKPPSTRCRDTSQESSDEVNTTGHGLRGDLHLACSSPWLLSAGSVSQLEATSENRCSPNSPASRITHSLPTSAIAMATTSAVSQLATISDSVSSPLLLANERLPQMLPQMLPQVLFWLFPLQAYFVV